MNLTKDSDAADFRVRMPRRELRPAGHPQRRPRRTKPRRRRRRCVNDRTQSMQEKLFDEASPAVSRDGDASLARRHLARRSRAAQRSGAGEGRLQDAEDGVGRSRSVRASTRTTTRAGSRSSGRAQFDGKKIDDVTDSELAELRRRSAIARPKSAPRISACCPAAIRSTGSRTSTRRTAVPWLVVDPPDGRVPPLVTEAQGRRGPGRRQQLRQRPVQQHARFQPVRPLHQPRACPAR